MTTSIAKTQPNDLANLPDKLEQLCRIVYHVNQLRQFPLSAVEVAEWSKSLLEYDENLDFEAIRFIIQEMKFCRMDWDKTEGIQNLIRGLKLIEKTETGYKVLRQNIF